MRGFSSGNSGVNSGCPSPRRGLRSNRDSPRGGASPGFQPLFSGYSSSNSLSSTGECDDSPRAETKRLERHNTKKNLQRKILTSRCFVFIDLPVI